MSIDGTGVYGCHQFTFRQYPTQSQSQTQYEAKRIHTDRQT